MSHNIALSGARITDLSLLANIVKDLTRGTCRLVKGQTTFRTYPGQSNVCDHCIVIGNGQYDIGLKRQKDGSYSLIGDFSMMANTSPFAARGQNLFQMFQTVQDARQNYDQACARYATGALMQEYALRTAEEQAAILGRKVERVPGKNGTITLEIVE